ncbi:MAG: hypothetical protein V4722_13400 [Bacteroidota bacterium]
MKKKSHGKKGLTFPLSAEMYERAKAELEQEEKNILQAVSINENEATAEFVIRRINGQGFRDFWKRVAG